MEGTKFVNDSAWISHVGTAGKRYGQQMATMD
jgi:hypothetical protein